MILLTASALAQSAFGERKAEVALEVFESATDDRRALKLFEQLMVRPPMSCRATKQLGQRLARTHPVDFEATQVLTLSGTELWCDHKTSFRTYAGRAEPGAPRVSIGSTSPALATWAEVNPSTWSVGLERGDAPLTLWGHGTARGLIGEAKKRGWMARIIQGDVEGRTESRLLLHKSVRVADFHSHTLFVAIAPGNTDDSLASIEFVDDDQFEDGAHDWTPHPLAVLEGEASARARLQAWTEHGSGLVCLTGCDGTGERVGALFGEVLDHGELRSATPEQLSGSFFLLFFDSYPSKPRLAVFGDWDQLEPRTGAHPTYTFADGRWSNAEPMVVHAGMRLHLSGPNPLGLPTLPVEDPESLSYEGFDRPVDRFLRGDPFAPVEKTFELSTRRKRTVRTHWRTIGPGFNPVVRSEDEKHPKYVWGDREAPVYVISVRDGTATLLAHHVYLRRFEGNSGIAARDNAGIEIPFASESDHVWIYNGGRKPGRLATFTWHDESDTARDERLAMLQEARQREAAKRKRAPSMAPARERRSLMDHLLEQRERFYTEVTVTNTGTSPCAVSVYGSAGTTVGALDLKAGASESILVERGSSAYRTGSDGGCDTSVQVR